MRCAILLTGFYRSFQQTWPSIEKLVNAHQMHVFISTWDKDSWASDKSTFTRQITKDDFPDSKHIVSIDVNDIDLYNSNRVVWKPNFRLNDVMNTDSRAAEHGPFWANRLRDQWYLVKLGWNRIKHYGLDYNLILRSRLDIAIHTLNFKDPNDKIIIPQDIGGWNYTDHMAYGGYHAMNKYCTFYDHMQSVYDDYNVDPTHAVEYPRFYLANTPKPIKYQIDNSIKYDIVILK